MNSGRDPISPADAWRFARGTFKHRWRLFVAVLLTILGGWVVLEIVVILGQELGMLFWSMAHLAFLLFLAGVTAGFLEICLALYDGESPALADAYRHLALAPRFLGGVLLYALMVAIGLVLGIVPGIYLGVRYAFFGFCLVDGETSLTSTWRQSADLSAGNRSSVLGALVALFVLNVLGLALLGLGLLITVPLSALVMTSVYRQLGTVGAGQ